VFNRYFLTDSKQERKTKKDYWNGFCRRFYGWMLGYLDTEDFLDGFIDSYTSYIVGER